MSDLMFTSEKVNCINKRVQDEISSKLFLFCNYCPSINVYISKDAKYILEVLNLYKLLIDTNCVIPKMRYILTGKEQVGEEWNEFYRKVDYDKLKSGLSIVNISRTILAHNIDERNGMIESNEQSSYNNWLKVIIKKDKPETEADFDKLLDALRQISENCESVLNNLITYVAESLKRDEIVGRWEEIILRWYKLKRNTFLGQMGSAWYSRMKGKGKLRGNHQIENGELIYNLDKWIQNYYNQPFEDEIKRITAVYEQFSGRIKKESERKRFDYEIRKKVEIQEAYCREMEKDIQSFCKKDKDIGIKDYEDYFFAVTLPDLLNETLKKERCSLYPQELLQLVIKNNFERVDID